MLKTLKDFEKLPKSIYFIDKCIWAYIDLFVVGSFLYIGYSRRCIDPNNLDVFFSVAIGESINSINIEDSIYNEGAAPDFESAVNMLYDYIKNQDNIKFEDDILKIT